MPQNEIIQQIFGSSPMPFFMVDDEFLVTWANDCAEKKYPQLLVSGGLFQLLSSEQLTLAKQQNDIFSVPLSIMPNFAAAFSKIDGGYLVGIGYSDPDSTEVMLPQSINFITGVISNQLRAPLSNLFGIVSSIARTADSTGDSRLEELAKGANSECYRLLRFTVDISAYLKYILGANSTEMQIIDLNFMLRELCAAAKMILPIPLKTSLPEQPVIIKADEQSLSHALLHIISNSCRYTREQNEITLSLAAKGESAVVTISDKGRGIPADMLSKVCEPFFSFDHDGMPFSGSGLGLAIAKDTVSRHGGTMAVTSVEGEGSSVAVSLPICRETELKLKETVTARDIVRDHKSLPYIILSDCCECPDP